MLLTGDALVIFDGLDELLDASRRIEAAAIVELFCAEYPLAPVLVTSRIVGYDQARLDDRQFSVYRLGGLSDEQVGEYVHKWFAQVEGIGPDEAKRLATAFLDESGTVADLRVTPLMLSLMCILYRGEGSLPRNRAQVYEQCAKVLYHRWDAQRGIKASLRADHLVEPWLRHLAWWMINLDATRTAVTEHELINKATEFLHGRGFETREDARQAAEEFINFCRGRMWVLTEMGVTATGEPMYAFTHRTFLEYFAGERLAYSSDTPDQLVDVLVPRVVSGEWDMLGELAIQIKDRTSDDGARRLYEALMARCDELPVAGRSAVLQFLARCLRSVEPPPATVRDFTAMVLDHLFAGNPDDQVHYLPLCWLMASSALCKDAVSKDMNTRIEAMIASTERATRKGGLRLAIWGPYGITWFGDNGPQLDRQTPLALYWRQRRDDNVGTYASLIVSAATDDPSMRNTAIWADLIGVDQALEMPGGIAALFRTWPTGIFGGQWGSELLSAARNLANGFLANDGAQLAMLGRYFVEHEPPWITGSAVEIWPGFFANHSSNDGQPARPLSPMSYLGAAITLLIAAEVAGQRTPPAEGAQWLGPLSGLYPYILRRWNLYPEGELPRLPVPDRFERLFHDWAAQRIDFVSP